MLDDEAEGFPTDRSDDRPQVFEAIPTLIRVSVAPDVEVVPLLQDQGPILLGHGAKQDSFASERDIVSAHSMPHGCRPISLADASSHSPGGGFRIGPGRRGRSWSWRGFEGLSLGSCQSSP